MIHWEDMGLSKMFENSRQFWPVYSDYEIDGEWIRPTGSEYEKTFPMDRPNLPFTLAEIILSDDHANAVLAFVRKWGLLGDQRMESNPAGVLMQELVEWIKTQAYDVSGILNSIHEGDNHNILRSINIEGLHFALVDSSHESAGYELGGEKMHTISGFTTPIVDPGEAILKLSVEVRWRSLLDVIHWHLASYAVGLKKLKRCAECRLYFEQTHGRQRYCPPEPADGSSRAQSNCSGRGRARRFREKKKSLNAS